MSVTIIPALTGNAIILNTQNAPLRQPCNQYKTAWWCSEKYSLRIFQCSYFLNLLPVVEYNCLNFSNRETSIIKKAPCKSSLVSCRRTRTFVCSFLCRNPFLFSWRCLVTLKDEWPFLTLWHMNFLKIAVQAACHSLLNCQIDCISLYCVTCTARENLKKIKGTANSGSTFMVVVYRTL